MGTPVWIARLPSSCLGLSREAHKPSVTSLSSPSTHNSQHTGRHQKAQQKAGRTDWAGQGPWVAPTLGELKAPAAAQLREAASQGPCQGILPLLQPPSRYPLPSWEPSRDG